MIPAILTGANRIAPTAVGDPAAAPDVIFSRLNPDSPILLPALPWELVPGPVRIADGVRFFTADQAAILSGKTLAYHLRDWRAFYGDCDWVVDEVRSRLTRLEQKAVQL